MVTLIGEIISVWREEQKAVFGRLLASFQRTVDGIFDLSSLTVSLKYPPAPRVFEIAFDGALEAVDIIADGFGRLPPIVAARVVLKHMKVSKKLRQGVMTLEQAAILPAKIIIEQGIRQSTFQPPRAWRLHELAATFEKIKTAIKFPTIFNSFRALFGTVWGKLVRLAFVVINLIRCLALLALLWNYVRFVQDETNWKTLFASALSQGNPRQKETGTIRRRIGGVKP